jgi:hypothetical protein
MAATTRLQRTRRMGLAVGTFAASPRCMQTIHAIIDISQLEAVSGGFPGTNQVPQQERPPPDNRDDLQRYWGRHGDSGTDKNFRNIVPHDTDKGLDRPFDGFAPRRRRQDS